MKRVLGWEQAGAAARDFWKFQETENQYSNTSILQLAEALAARDSSIDDFYETYLRSGTFSIPGNLSYLDYERLKNNQWDGDLDVFDKIRDPRQNDAAAMAFTKTGKWGDRQILSRVQAVMEKTLKHRTATKEVRSWWDELFARYEPKVLLRIAEELSLRVRETKDLHEAVRKSGGTDKVPAMLAYLDYDAEKAEKKKRALTHATAGYEHAKFPLLSRV